MKKVLTIAALLSTAAFADQVSLASITAGAPIAGANYTFNYEFNVSDDVRYEVGDFFTVYDFLTAIGAATTGQAQALGFTASVQNSGINPASGAPAPVFGGDNSGITNVTFTKTATGTGNLQGPISGVAGFVIYSQFGCGDGRNQTDVNSCSDIYFKGEGTNDSGGPRDGTFNGSEGNTSGPNSVIPEPATMGLMGGALLGLGMLARRRK